MVVCVQSKTCVSMTSQIRSSHSEAYASVFLTDLYSAISSQCVCGYKGAFAIPSHILIYLLIRAMKFLMFPTSRELLTLPLSLLMDWNLPLSRQPKEQVCLSFSSVPAILNLILY